MHITHPWDNDSEGDEPHKFEFFQNNIAEFKAVAELQESEPFCQKLSQELKDFLEVGKHVDTDDDLACVELQRHKLSLKINDLGIPKNISCYFHSGLRKKIQQLEAHLIDSCSVEKRSLETFGMVPKKPFKDSNCL